jgi:UDP-glucose 4-epimerase
MCPDPISPYGATKLAGEIYARVFTTVYGLETVSLRFFNVFGPRQDPTSPYSGVLSLFIAALLEGRRPTIFGDGEQSRDFTYVDNVVEALLLACAAPNASGKVFNVATGQRYSLNRIFAYLRSIIGGNIEPIYGQPRPGDILHSQADISLARKALGYKPKVMLEEGLRRTVAWYAEELEGSLTLACQ